MDGYIAEGLCVRVRKSTSSHSHTEIPGMGKRAFLSAFKYGPAPCVTAAVCSQNISLQLGCRETKSASPARFSLPLLQPRGAAMC